MTDTPGTGDEQSLDLGGLDGDYVPPFLSDSHLSETDRYYRQVRLDLTRRTGHDIHTPGHLFTSEMCLWAPDGTFGGSDCPVCTPLKTKNVGKWKW